MPTDWAEGGLLSKIDSSGLMKSTSSMLASSLGKAIKNFGKQAKKDLKPLKKESEEGKKKGKTLQVIGRALMDSIGIILQFADAVGILQPILEIVGGFFQIIGAAAMQALAPALEHLASKFSDPEFIKCLEDLGTLLGTFLGGAIRLLVDLLPILLKAFMPILKLLGSEGMIAVITILAKVIATLIIGALVPLITVIYFVGVIIAGIMDFFTGGVNHFAENWTKSYLGYLYDIGQGVADIWALQSGGYVAPSAGGTLVTVAEGGEGEFIVPESKMGEIGMSRDMLYATQDNGEKLDKIALLLQSKGRLI